MQKNTRAENSLISTNLTIFATICTSAFIGAFGADLWANTKYNGALEGHRSSGSTEGQSNDKVAQGSCLREKIKKRSSNLGKQINLIEAPALTLAPAAAPAGPSSTDILLMEIRDSLKK